LNASYGKVWRNGLWISYPEVYGVELRFVYTVISRRTSKD
jgi:hypothetical protein